MGHVLIPYDWNEFVFHKGCSFSIRSILENGLIAGGKQSKEGRQTIFFTPLNPFGENPHEEAPHNMTSQFPRKCTITAIGNIIKTPLIGQNCPEHKIKDCGSGRRSQVQ